MSEHVESTREVALSLLLRVPASSDLLAAYHAARTDDAALCLAITEEIVSWWQAAGCQVQIERCAVVRPAAEVGGDT